MTEYQDLNADQVVGLIIDLNKKYIEYQAKGGPADNMRDFWRWVSGLDHVCPNYSLGRWDDWSGGVDSAARAERLRKAQEQWEQAAREDMIKLKDEDLSDEPDAW